MVRNLQSGMLIDGFLWRVLEGVTEIESGIQNVSSLLGAVCSV